MKTWMPARKRGGSNELAWIQPTCVCGWEGDKCYAYQDDQYHLVKSQEADHIASHRKAPRAGGKGMSDIRAEIEIDPQHGPIIRVQVNERTVSVYLMHETGTVLEPSGGQYGIEVKGPWWQFRQMMETPMLGADGALEDKT